MVLGETRYAKSGDVNIAYQVVGEGPLDLVLVPGWVSHVEHAWEDPSYAGFLNRLVSFCRLILIDRRGTGLSDPVAELPTLEQRMDDVRAVMDAANSEHAALFGISEGGPLCMLFAATYPQRTSALVLYGTFAKAWWNPAEPSRSYAEEREHFLKTVEAEWGRGTLAKMFAPSIATDERLVQAWGRFERLAVSPGAALAVFRMAFDSDVRHVLSAIRTPSLVVQRSDDPMVRPSAARYVAEHISGARYVELPGGDHFPWTGDFDAICDEVEEFLTGVRRGPEPDRVLATVLFTDIVGATERAAAVGDRHWRNLLERHHSLVRRELQRFRGREVDTAGDSFFATFDGPARAIRCACAIRDAVTSLGLTIRSGLHTGECEMMGHKISGIAVHTGARVMGQAGPSEVLVSSTVKDLVAGSGLRFADRGMHVLKGVPDEWHLFAVEQ